MAAIREGFCNQLSLPYWKMVQERALTFKHIVKKLSLKKKDDIKIAGQIMDQLEEDERILQLA